MRNAGSGTNANAFCLCLKFAVAGRSQSHCARLHSFACRQHISVIKVPLSAFGYKRLFDAAYEQPTPPPPCLGWGVKKACISCCFVCKMQDKFDLLLSTRKFRPRGSWSKCRTFMLWNMNLSNIQLKANNPHVHKRTNTFQGNYLRSELYVGLTWRRNWLRRHSRTCVLHGGDSRPKWVHERLCACDVVLICVAQHIQNTKLLNIYY